MIIAELVTIDSLIYSFVKITVLGLTFVQTYPEICKNLCGVHNVYHWTDRQT